MDVFTKASNEGSRRLHNHGEGLTGAFSWLKAPSGALTLLRHYAKPAPKSENGTKIINDDGRLQESMPTYLALLS